MNKLFTLLLGVALTVPMAASASSNMMGVSRGGLGFLFPDNNSFANPGHFSQSHGFAVEAIYEKQDQSSVQDVDTSVVYGNGHFGIGAFGNRAGTQLNTPAADLDTAGAGLGVSFAGNRVSLGVGYQRVISVAPPDNGTVSTSLTLNPAGERGFGVGVRATTSIKPATGRSVQTGTVAAGYSFRQNCTLEAFGTVNDFADARDDTGGVALTLGGPYLYLGTAFLYNRLAANYEAAARVGLILGHAVDFSLLADRVLQTGAVLTYGASLRATF